MQIPAIRRNNNEKCAKWGRAVMARNLSGLFKLTGNKNAALL
jgi:hypothetical protein